MKKIMTFTLICLVATATFAQNGAKDLLDKVAAKVESYNNIEIEFNHVFENVEADIKQEARGKVVLKKDLYHLYYMGTEQIFDGKKTYLIIHEDEEVIIQNIEDMEEEENITPSKLFSFYKNGYSYEMGGIKTVNGIKTQEVILTPINSDSTVDNIVVAIDNKTNHIYSISETGKNSSKTVLTIRSMKTNQPISEKLFIFDDNKYRVEKNYTISEPN